MLVVDHSWMHLYKLCSSLPLLFLTMGRRMPGVGGDNSPDLKTHMDMGNHLLSVGKFTEALTHYHSAVSSDPDNYMAYYKRATVLLALGRSKAAIPDLDMVIKLRRDFYQAWEQRGNIYLKHGLIEDAHWDYTVFFKANPNAPNALKNLALVNEMEDGIPEIEELFDDDKWKEVVDRLAKPVEVMPWNIEIRRMRAHAYERLGETLKVIQDLRMITKLTNDDTEGHLKISQLYYQMGNGEDSLKEIRLCLKLDQDHKDCKRHYKKVKKLVKLLQEAQEHMDGEQFEDALVKLNKAHNVEYLNMYFVVGMQEKMCTCYLKVEDSKKAIRACTEAIKIEPSNVNAYCDRAGAHLLEDNLDEALKDYKSAKEKNTNSNCANDGINKVNKLIKQSKKKDYYKILGVSRTASKPEIMKKFRKMAAKWHPDKFKDEEREEAEKKFIDIAAAKEVLTDPDKRAKYDQGEDPLDPEGGRGGHQYNPFEGFDFSDFGGFSGFKFHFK